MKANHKDKKIPFNGKDIIIKRGQFITGRSTALKEMKNLTVYGYLAAIKYLKTAKRIEQQTYSKFSLITVCNYDNYQSQESEHQQVFQTANLQQPNTNKNDKNKSLYGKNKIQRLKGIKHVMQNG